MNRMYYIKCGVNNSSLHNSGCCIRSVAPWITVLSRHTVFTKRVIYYKFTFVWYSVKQGTTQRPTSHLAHCALSLDTRKTQTAEQLAWFHWSLFVTATYAEAGCCCCSSSSSSSKQSSNIATFYVWFRGCASNQNVTPEQATVKASSVRTISVSLEKCAVTKCLHICQCLWRGLGGGGGTFWLLNESLIFKGPEA